MANDKAPGKVMQAERFYDIDEQNNRLTYRFRRYSMGKIYLAIIAVCFLPMYPFMIWLNGVLSPVEASMKKLQWAAAVWIVGTILVILWAKRPKIKKIIVDHHGITANRKTYPLKDIEEIRYSGMTVNYATASGMSGAANLTGMYIGSAMSGWLIIRFGSRNIALINQIHPDAAAAGYEVISKFLDRFEWGSGNHG